jgi:hypothetical protein
MGDKQLTATLTGRHRARRFRARPATGKSRANKVARKKARLPNTPFRQAGGLP